MAQGSGSDHILKQLRRPLVLTRVGMVAERLLLAFWPLLALGMACLGLLMLGAQDHLPLEMLWGGVVLAVAGGVGTLTMGVRRMRWPSLAEALTRLDDTLPGHPIQSLMDDQTIGADDPESRAIWRAHQKRMAQRAATARAVRPNMRLSAQDPYGLRFVAMLVFAMAVLFGSLWQVGTVAQITSPNVPLAHGPSWEGWVEPPAYTGLATLYLNDLVGQDLEIPKGSRIQLRFYGEVGALTLAETVSGRIGDLPSASDPEQSFDIEQDGTFAINGPNGHSWAVRVLPDMPPNVVITGAPDVAAMGRTKMPFEASDDYGVQSGVAQIVLDVDAIDTRHGLAIEPDPRDPIVVDLPMPLRGDRRAFTETLVAEFAQHPWANLPVIIALTVTDEAGQSGASAPFQGILAARHFFDPLAAAVIEQRRDLLWARANGRRVAQVLRAISHRPDGLFRDETTYLRMRVILRRLETFNRIGLTAAHQDEIAQALWDLAVLIEDGDIGDALERLRRAQERLSQAMKNGASDDEIAELMRELSEATEDYMRQLSQQAQQQDLSTPQNGESMTLTQQDLQRMMDRIQELMEQGRMAEAEQALREFQEMMENLRITQGQGGQSDGQRAMEGLADTLRNQQGLSDQAFRDLQEQFNPGGRAGESDGNEGRNGGQGRGQSHEGQGGQGQGGDSDGSLADRQQALRDQLRNQRQSLPGAGTAQGDAARDALDRAGDAMDQAEQALRDGDLAEAIDRQAQAMEQLREGMTALGEALAQENQGQPGQNSSRNAGRSQSTDPLGRQQGSAGAAGTDEGVEDREDVYRRARELLDEIRRRAGETDRDTFELDYLKRLLDRF